MAFVRVRGRLQKLLPCNCSFVNTSLCVGRTICFIVSHRGRKVVGAVSQGKSQAVGLRCKAGSNPRLVICPAVPFCTTMSYLCVTFVSKPRSYITWGKLPLCSVQQSGTRGFFVAHTASSCPTFVWLERIIKRTVQKVGSSRCHCFHLPS